MFSQNPHLDVQVTATVHTGSSIAIVFRRSTQGVTVSACRKCLQNDFSQPQQRLGEFKIPIAKDAGYNVLDWCATASNAVAESQAIATSATAKVRDLEATMKDLKSQLDELLKAKEDDETTLLLKFRDLLNEKKVKIREQRKIIASLPTSSLVSQAQPSQTTRLSPPPVQQEIKQSGSRSTKRKAAVPVVEDDSSEGGFEPMEFDKIKSEPEDTDPSNDTESTASTASDDEEDVAPIPAPAVSSQGLKTPLKNTAAKPPPPRALPFARNKPGPASPARPPTGAESETESDDEL